MYYLVRIVSEKLFRQENYLGTTCTTDNFLELSKYANKANLINKLHLTSHKTNNKIIRCSLGHSNISLEFTLIISYYSYRLF